MEMYEDRNNEFQILEFTINGTSYGMDVANIKEIVIYQFSTPIPDAHPSIEGTFISRDTKMTVIDLKKYLQCGSSEPCGIFIITSLAKFDNIAFHIENMNGICSASYSDIIKPISSEHTAYSGIEIGSIKKENKAIVILNFEKIANISFLKQD